MPLSIDISRGDAVCFSPCKLPLQLMKHMPGVFLLMVIAHGISVKINNGVFRRGSAVIFCSCHSKEGSG